MSTKTELSVPNILQAKDDAVISIRGHVAIETILSEVITHALPSPHEVEIERISFPLKVDLVIGLRAISEQSRPLLMKLNKVRNRFAHRAEAVLDDTDRQEILNGMSEHQRALVGPYYKGTRNPTEALKLGIIAAFYEAKEAADILFQRSIEKAAMLEEIEKVLTKCRDVGLLDGEDNSFQEKLRSNVQGRLRKIEDSETNST